VNSKRDGPVQTEVEITDSLQALVNLIYLIGQDADDIAATRTYAEMAKRPLRCLTDKAKRKDWLHFLN
jgi:hypothetical protein